jgi:hypothetical protein
VRNHATKNADDDLSRLSDGFEFFTFCPECAEREFGPMN